MKYVCELCGTVYDEAQGVPKQGVQAGTAFEQLPADFSCPGCGSGLEAFDPVAEAKTNGGRTQAQVLRQYVKYGDNKLESER